MFLKYKNYNLVAAGFSLRKLFGSRKPWFAHIICSCRPWSAKIKLCNYNFYLFCSVITATTRLLRSKIILECNNHVIAKKIATT